MTCFSTGFNIENYLCLLQMSSEYYHPRGVMIYEVLAHRWMCAVQELADSNPLFPFVVI